MAKAKGKGKKETKPTAEAPTFELEDPFVGGEDDDLMDMQYIQDETKTTKIETHPPETEEEAEALKEQEPKEEEKEDVEVEGQAEEAGEEAEEAEAKEEPEVLAEEAEVEVEEDPKVPKGRFDEVNDRMKKAEEKVSKLEKQLEVVVEEKTAEPEPEQFDYAAKEKESYDAFLEGDTEKYSAVQQEIREAEKAELERSAKRIASEGDRAVKDDLTFEEVGERIESGHPEFVEGTEQFNKEAYDELMELYVGYSRTGKYTRADALQKAADQTVRIYGFGESEAEEVTDTSNVVDIKKPDIKKKTKIADNQPPIKESGTEDDAEPTIDPVSMSDEEFANLPEATKRRMRGDVL